MQRKTLNYLCNNIIRPIRNMQFKKACHNKNITLSRRLLLKGVDVNKLICRNITIEYTQIILNKPFRIKNEYLLDQVFNYTRSERTQNQWKNLFSDMVRCSKQIDICVLNRLLYSACNLFFLKPTTNKDCGQSIIDMINALIEKGATVNKELLEAIYNYTYMGIHFSIKKKKLLNAILTKYAEIKTLNESCKLVKKSNIDHKYKKQLLTLLNLDHNNRIINLCIKSNMARNKGLQKISC